MRTACMRTSSRELPAEARRGAERHPAPQFQVSQKVINFPFLGSSPSRQRAKPREISAQGSGPGPLLTLIYTSSAARVCMHAWISTLQSQQQGSIFRHAARTQTGLMPSCAGHKQD